MAQRYYEPNRRDMRKFLESPEMGRVVTQVAEKLKGRVVRNTPVESGELAGSWQVTARMYGDRQIALVYTDKKYAPVVEARTRFVGRALR